MTERMVDGDGTTISLVGLNLHRQWTLEYESRVDGVRFGFIAYRNEISEFEKDPTVAPRDYWIVPFSYSLLLPALKNRDRLDAAVLIGTVEEKIRSALLAWPMDDNLNTVQATSVSIRYDDPEVLSDVLDRAESAQRRMPVRRFTRWGAVLLALVAIHFLVRWLRTL